MTVTKSIHYNLNNCLLEELTVQREQVAFPGVQGLPGSLPSAAWAHAQVPPQNVCSMMPRGDRQVLISPNPALPSSLSP